MVPVHALPLPNSIARPRLVRGASTIIPMQWIVPPGSLWWEHRDTDLSWHSCTWRYSTSEPTSGPEPLTPAPVTSALLAI